MDSSLLEKFRLQLASWVEARLESQRLPFQRLEICPRTLTERGRLAPDMVLWINRDSQLAGSMILLPVTVNEKTLADGQALAKALGLGHFTTWAAREVAVWGLATGTPEKLNSFFLPPANRIIPQDFQDTLDDLLEQLKIVTVTQAPSNSEYSTHYFANLCLRNLQELAPGLAVSARLSGGQTAADEWVEQAPREKAWMSLWRMLFLLWQGRLPPGLQPERLENAISYALDELAEGTLEWLAPQENEPPLPEEEAVRLYHLAGRLRQLGWPRDTSSATELISLLLKEAAHRFSVEAPELPWATADAELRVFCQPDDAPGAGRIVIAPRAYLAGSALHEALSERPGRSTFAEELNSLGSGQTWASASAVLNSPQKLSHQESKAKLILLRNVWPNRRFDLPRNTPTWLWDMLFLSGLISKEISLTLPEEWHMAAGLETLWNVLKGHWQISELNISDSGYQSLRLLHTPSGVSTCQVHRGDQKISIPNTLGTTYLPGTIQLWLQGHLDVVEMVIEKMTFGLGEHWQEDQEQLQLGAHLYLQTTLGSYLWSLCSSSAPLPEQHETLQAIQAHGVPIPNEQILSELAMTMALHVNIEAEAELLNNEFKGLFGEIPAVENLSKVKPPSGTIKMKRKLRLSSDQITAKVFMDGLPLFPDHYLMEVYRPSLTSYQLKGPMEIVESFFDRVSLQAIGKDYTIEVAGGILAEALILASHCNEGEVALPNDEQLLEEIVLKYRNDLNKLWEDLTRECRGATPLRQSAVKLARRIWQEHGLPTLAT